MSSGGVTIGLLHGGKVFTRFALSLIDLLRYDSTHEEYVDPGRGLAAMGFAGSHANTRNHLVRHFLAGPDEWLLQLDTDEAFAPTTLARLVTAADPVSRPIMAGVVPVPFDDGRIVLSFDLESGSGFRPGQVVEAAMTGTGCLLVHRRVFETLEKASPGPWPWFGYVVNDDGEMLGEDGTFCRRARAAGFPLYVHTGVVLDHLGKDRTVTFGDYRAQFAGVMALDRAAASR